MPAQPPAQSSAPPVSAPAPLSQRRPRQALAQRLVEGMDPAAALADWQAQAATDLAALQEAAGRLELQESVAPDLPALALILAGAQIAADPAARKLAEALEACFDPLPHPEAESALIARAYAELQAMAETGDRLQMELALARAGEAGAARRAGIARARAEAREAVLATALLDRSRQP